MADDREQLIDDYLDGRLEGEQRQAFERRLEQEHDLRAAVDRMSRIDESLGRLFTPPPVEGFVERINVDKAGISGQESSRKLERIPRLRRRSILRHPALIAATLVLGVFGGWRLWSFGRLNTADLLGMLERKTLEFEYQQQVVQHGFKPLWICDTDEEFITSFRDGLGQALLLAQLPAKTEAIGLSYGKCMSPKTMVLLAYADKRQVVVFVDRLKNDHAFTKKWWTGLNVFRREIGDLVAYECTPLDRPHLLDALRMPSPKGAKGQTGNP